MDVEFDYDLFRKRVREYRQKMQMSQNELANKVDTELNTIENIELGKTEPLLKNVVGILNSFHLNLDHFLNGDNQTQEEILKNEILYVLSYMTEERITILLKLSEILKLNRLKGRGDIEHGVSTQSDCGKNI